MSMNRTIRLHRHPTALAVGEGFANARIARHSPCLCGGYGLQSRRELKGGKPMTNALAIQRRGTLSRNGVPVTAHASRRTPWHIGILLCLLTTSSIAFAGADKVAICHYSADTDTWKLINVGAPAAAAHLGNHGDVVAGDYYPDADGDGYGDGFGATTVCPTDGYVMQTGDCSDDDAAVNPGAEEICGDSIDNDCDGLVDEDCTVSCRCSGGTIWEHALESAPLAGPIIEGIDVFGRWEDASGMWGDIATVGTRCWASNPNGEELVDANPQDVQEACSATILGWYCENGWEDYCGASH